MTFAFSYHLQSNDKLKYLHIYTMWTKVCSFWLCLEMCLHLFVCFICFALFLNVNQFPENITHYSANPSDNEILSWYCHNESRAYRKCHQNNSWWANLNGSWGQAEIWCAWGGSGGTWCTHGTRVSLITGSQKSSQMGRGMGAVPGVTHLDFEESILLQ